MERTFSRLVNKLETKGAADILKYASVPGVIPLSAGSPSQEAFPTKELADIAAAKAGIIGLTRHISMDLGQYGITINAVAPGTVLSGPRVEDYWKNRKSEAERQAFLASNPLGRLGTVDDIADAVLFLSSDKAAYITGAVLDVNGGSWVG